MKVLLSGSHGLIGSAVTRSLARRGDEVVALVRSEGPVPAAAATVRWDPARGEVDDEALVAAGPFDGVVHLAGAGIGDRRWTPARRREIEESRVAGTALLAASVRRLPQPPVVVVSGSAIGYYGARGSETLTETCAPGTGFLASLCVAWEEAAASLEDVCRVVRVRTGVVLAKHGGALARQLPLFRLGLGGRLGDGSQYVSWITLRDEVDVVLRALDDGRLSGPVNATAPTPVTNAELTAALARVLHRPALLGVGRLPLELALGRDLVTEAVLASQRVVPAALTALGHRFSDPGIDGALAAVVAGGSPAQGG